MGEKHSAVGYLFREGAFLPAQETKPVRNEFGLDLFQHRGSVYEGKTGLQFCSLQQAEDLAGFVEKHGGIEKVQKLIADSLERTGLSPRYTRPDEKKKDIFPPKEKDENRVFAKDLMGNKHYYYRFYNENGIELYTMEKKREFFQTVYIPCDGFMVGIDQRHRLEEVLKWLPTLEHGIRGEIERVFNQSMEASDRWADLGFANLLGRYEEAKAHNAPIATERQRQADERRAQQEVREQQLAQERQARYDSAIREAEGDIMAGKEVINREINGKSLIMQLFREHEIPVPLKTQGWIINSLHSIRYEPQNGEWHYRYFKGSRDSTKMFDLLSKLSAAIQTRQQFEEHGASPPDTPVLDCEEEQEMRIVAATTDEEMLHTIIGAQILGGTMDYRGFSNMKGFEQFRAACRTGDVQYSNLDYGFVEQTENLMLPDCAKEPQLEKAYRLLNLSDHEFNAIRNGSLESLGEDRARLILDKALSWAAQNYAGWDLYRHLRDELGMSNEEIGKTGFDLDEFYEDEAADSAEYEVEADYGEEL